MTFTPSDEIRYISTRALAHGGEKAAPITTSSAEPADVVTPAMIRAGLTALHRTYPTRESQMRAIYQAMRDAKEETN
jgi:hypothetical protein